MNYEAYRTTAYIIVVMFGAAFNAKFLGPSIVAALALTTAINNTDAANFIFAFYLSTLILAGFRE